MAIPHRKFIGFNLQLSQYLFDRHMYTKLFVSYELSPFTSGGMGTYLHNVLRIASAEGVKTCVLLGLPIAEVEKIKANLTARIPFSGVIPEIMSAFELANEKSSQNVFWNRSALFCDAILKLMSLRRIDYIEFFDYCGPAYHTLMEKCTNRLLKDVEISVRFHNTIELIDRSSGILKARGPNSPYGLERSAMRIADQLIVPGAKVWAETAAELYQIDANRITVIAPPFATDSFPKKHANQSGIAFVGRPSVLKGFDTFLDALLQVHDNCEVELPAVVVIGPPETVVGALNVLSELEKRPALKSKISVTGHVPQAELMQMLGAFDLVIFPNRSESYCYALHEAILSGVRVIVNSIPAFVEHLESSNRCMFFDGTSYDLAQKIVHSLRLPAGVSTEENLATRSAYIQRSKQFFNRILDLPASPSATQNSALCVISSRVSNVGTDLFSKSLTVKWNSIAPSDSIIELEDGQPMELRQFSGPVYLLRLFENNISIDQLARARTTLLLNSTLSCAAIFSNVLEELLVSDCEALLEESVNIKITPAAVMWRFERLGLAIDHIAKHMHTIEDVNLLKRISNPCFIGCSDHHGAMLTATRVASSTRMLNAVQHAGTTIGQADARLLSMSKADVEAGYIFLVRGHVEIKLGQGAMGLSKTIAPLFGFFDAPYDSLESWFGGIKVKNNKQDFTLSVLSETAEMWVYRNGQKVVHLTSNGIVTVAYAEYGPMVLAAQKVGSTSDWAILDYADRTVRLKLSSEYDTCLSDMQTWAKPADSTIICADMDEIICRLATITAREVQIALPLRLLCGGAMQQICSAAQYVREVCIAVALPDNFMFSQDWVLHHGLLDSINTGGIPNLTVTLFASNNLAETLSLVGIQCNSTPLIVSDRPVLKSLRSADPGVRIPNILLSSTGTFSGIYGHVLCALAIARSVPNTANFRFEIIAPNDESSHLICDLGLNDIASIRLQPTSMRHDIILEVYPDGPLSLAAKQTLNNGASGIFSTASQPWVNVSDGVSYVPDWEAADSIASELIRTLNIYFGGAKATAAHQ